MFTKTRLLSTTTFLFAAILALGGSAVVGQEPPPPVPSDDDVIGAKCPEKLAFVHLNVYYYRMMDCPNGSTNIVQGFPHPVVTGCKENDCLTDIEPLVSLTPGSVTTTTGKMPDNLVDSADVVLLNLDIAGDEVRKPDLVKIDNNGTLTYWALVFVKIKDRVNPQAHHKYRMAFQFDKEPAGAGSFATAKIVAGGVEYANDTYVIMTN